MLHRRPQPFVIALPVFCTLQPFKKAPLLFQQGLHSFGGYLIGPDPNAPRMIRLPARVGRPLSLQHHLGKSIENEQGAVQPLLNALRPGKFFPLAGRCFQARPFHSE